MGRLKLIILFHKLFKRSNDADKKQMHRLIRLFKRILLKLRKRYKKLDYVEVQEPYGKGSESVDIDLIPFITIPLVTLGALSLEKRVSNKKSQPKELLNLEQDSISYDVVYKSSNRYAGGAYINNPMNIRPNRSGDDWQGSIGTESLGKSGTFQKFSDPYWSIRAAAVAIMNYPRLYKSKVDKYGGGKLTMEAILYIYAPPTDNNDTEGYIRTMEALTGMSRDTVIDFKSNKQQFIKWMKASAKVETSANISENYLGLVWEALYNGGTPPLQDILNKRQQVKTQTKTSIFSGSRGSNNVQND